MKCKDRRSSVSLDNSIQAFHKPQFMKPAADYK